MENNFDNEALGYGVTEKEVLEMFCTLSQEMDKEDFQDMISAVFDAPKPQRLTDVAVPEIYNIPTEVSERYRAIGINLVQVPLSKKTV